MRIVEVVVELGVKSVDYPFSYLLPECFDGEYIVGKRVVIPFGKTTYQGFVIKYYEADEHEYELKKVIDVVDTDPVFNEEFIKLGHHLSETTYSYLITAYQAMVPKSLKAKIGSKPNIKSEYYVTVKNEELAYQFLDSKTRALKQIEAVEVMLSEAKMTRPNFNKTFSAQVLKALISKEILEVTKEEVYREVFNEYVESSDKLILNSEQQAAYDEIVSEEAATYMLHGVTGSGKTEVYMQAIEHCLKEGKEAIVLVPEIALTKQMIKRFVSRFGKKVAILHSRLNHAEKYDEYRKIYRKEVKIAVGARSAIFAPFENLGLIVIDEEHETTYKQESSPKYHALDVAKFRASHHQCSIVLGSATPSLESYARAQKGVYKLLTISNRVNNLPLPKVEIINMKEESNKGNYSIISTRLNELIKDRIAKGEQTILLLNRRGYSTFLTCRECHHSFKCPHCDISLTYHKYNNTLSCHYCGYTIKKPTSCPVCNSQNLRDFGLGTEQLEEYIMQHITGARVVRMDADTTSRKDGHASILNAFEREEYNILLGTQMIAKGLDFANVTLVGVLNADYSINIPDFRSSERTFQLISQVSGRAGRKELHGEVVIQTYDEDHYSIVYAKNHDYLSFYNKEMGLRRTLGYPPYYYLTKIMITSKDFRKVIKDAANIRDLLIMKNMKQVKVLGPSPAAVPKIKDLYRYQIVVKYKDGTELSRLAKEIIESYESNRYVNVDFDNNPLRLF